jgi:hypothetical protein
MEGNGDCFIESARELECDDDKERFEGRLNTPRTKHIAVPITDAFTMRRVAGVIRSLVAIVHGRQIHEVPSLSALNLGEAVALWRCKKLPGMF